MKFLRLSPDQVQAGQALAWNVYNEHQQLLLHKGYVLQTPDQVRALIERGVFIDQDDFAQHQRQRAQAQRAQNAVALWHDVHRRLEQLLQHAEAMSPQAFRDDLQACAHGINHGIERQRDASLFELLHADDPDGYTVRHAMQTAFVASLVGQGLGWSAADRDTLTHAALTMNLGMSRLQSELCGQSLPLNPQQRDAVTHHADRSCQQLEAKGVTDKDWLQAVAQHHVTPNGGPLPANHAQLSEQACMLHYKDVYLAKISARAYRPAMTAHAAARSLFMQADGQRNPYVSALIKELGVYPPGSCVRLANGEVGVVVRRGEAAHLPEVRSLTDPHGLALPSTPLRDTAQAPYKVVEGLPRHALTRRMDRQALFA